MARADEVLELVGLRDAARRKVRGYSMGMRQRLSLAAALLGDPRAIVLDEPANGLDPEGIRWLRGLLRRLADQGRTVLVSSHQLAEVEAVADRVVILNRSASCGRARSRSSPPVRTSSSCALPHPIRWPRRCRPTAAPWAAGVARSASRSVPRRPRHRKRGRSPRAGRCRRAAAPRRGARPPGPLHPRRRLTTDVLDRGLGSGHHDTEDHVERPRHPETRVCGSDHVDDTAGQLGDRHGEGRQVHLAAGVGGGPSGALPPARPRGRPQVRGARILYPLEEHRQLIACVQLQLVIGRLRLPRSLRSWCGSDQEGWQSGALPARIVHDRS